MALDSKGNDGFPVFVAKWALHDGCRIKCPVLAALTHRERKLLILK